MGDAHVLGGTTADSGTTLSYYQGSWNVTHVEIPEEGWVHVIWRNTQQEMELYIDGVLEFTGPPVPPGRIFGFMNIGIRHNGVEGYEGLIDDVFLWDDSENPLTEDSIAAIAGDGLASFLGLDTDSDRDGLPNGWEEEHGLDENDDGTGDVANGPDGDPDDDGLSNLQEFERGTSPRDADSDDDMLNDGQEVALKTNPRSADTDRDGVSDGREVELGTEPDNPDSDGDGFLDGFEIEVQSDPNDAQSVPSSASTLVLHLDFDGSLEDQSPGGHDGEPLGEPAFENDAPASLGGGQSLRFHPGDADGVTIAASDDLDSDVFTLAYFANQDGAEQGNAGLERLTSRGGDRFETAIGNANAVGGADPGTLSYYSPATAWRPTGVSVPESGWAHVAWRNRGTGAEDMELFLDGELRFTGPGVTLDSAGLMNVGIRHNGVEGYEGLMDDLRLYSIALSDAEIMALPNQTSGVLQIREASRDAGGRFHLTWTSAPGQFFEVQKSTSLIPGDWTTVGREIPAAGDPAEMTSFSVETAPQDLQAYFRVGRVPPPPLFFDDFESGGQGWTTGRVENFEQTATEWELGPPTGGPGEAFSGEAVYGTGLDADYESNSGIFLRSPVLDFTGRGRTRLSFWYYVDASPQEGGRLNLRNAEGELLQSLKIYDGNQPTTEWIQDTITLPSLEGRALVEFEFLSDDRDGDNGAGWFIDDVLIQ